MVQAGTGIGKSLAYLVPALQCGKRVVVTTATKALQDQLAGKDLPFLADRLGRTFTFALLKGRSNYVCRQRLAEISGETQLALDGLAQRASPSGSRSCSRGRSTARPAIGPGPEPSPQAWAAVSVSSRNVPAGNAVRRAASASPSSPTIAPPRPTSWWSTRICTGSTSKAAA